MKDQFFDFEEQILAASSVADKAQQLEKMAQQLNRLQGSPHHEIRQPHLVVFAGDHGFAESAAANAEPAAATAPAPNPNAALLNQLLQDQWLQHHLLPRDAETKKFGTQLPITVKLADAGLKTDFPEWQSYPAFISAKIAPGTRNFLEGPAMSFEETERAIAVGRFIVSQIAGSGCNAIAICELGPDSGPSASLLAAALLKLPLEQCVDRSTNAGATRQKLATLQTVYNKHLAVIELHSPLKTLQYLGGYEIAMMVGAYLGAAEHKMTLLVDGFISGVALLLAQSLQPRLMQNCKFGNYAEENGYPHLRN